MVTGLGMLFSQDAWVNEGLVSFSPSEKMSCGDVILVLAVTSPRTNGRAPLQIGRFNLKGKDGRNGLDASHGAMFQAITESDYDKLTAAVSAAKKPHRRHIWEPEWR